MMEDKILGQLFIKSQSLKRNPCHFLGNILTPLYLKLIIPLSILGCLKLIVPSLFWEVINILNLTIENTLYP